MPKMTKPEFIESELLNLTINGAFQRANVYAVEIDEGDPRRNDVRRKLKELLRELVSHTYKTEVSEAEHELKIQQLANDLTNEFARDGILRDAEFRIGISQKALNLFLKYLWCVDRIPMPPHCPFDDMIIAKLCLSDKDKARYRWTKIRSLAEYQFLVERAKSIKGDKYNSLAEWELAEWPRE
jgi:hypothetical protein